MKYNFIKFFIVFFFIIFLNSKVSISETSQDKIFEVKNISVNVESTSSFKAKEIAILEAQEKGFKNLMNKMLLELEYKKIGSIKINTILVDDRFRRECGKAAKAYTQYHDVSILEERWENLFAR